MRMIGMSWMIISIIGSLMVGFFGIAYVSANNLSLNDAETIFILLSQVLFHPLIVDFPRAAGCWF